MKKLLIMLIIVLMMFAVACSSDIGTVDEKEVDEKEVFEVSKISLGTDSIPILDSNVTFSTIEGSDIATASSAFLADNDYTTQSVVDAIKSLYDFEELNYIVTSPVDNSSYPTTGSIKAGDVSADFILEFEVKDTHKFDEEPPVFTFRIEKIDAKEVFDVDYNLLFTEGGNIPILDSDVTFAVKNSNIATTASAFLVDRDYTTQSVVDAIKNLYTFEGLNYIVTAPVNNPSYPTTGPIQAGDVRADFTLEFEVKNTHKFDKEPPVFIFRIEKTVGHTG